MVPVPLIIVLICNFVLSFYLLNRYGNLAKHNVMTTISVFVSWFFSFNVIFILPLDITSTIHNLCTLESTISQSIANTTQPSVNTTVFNVTNFINQTVEIFNQTTVVACEKPWSYIPTNVLLTLWHFTYWTSQVLTWIILPLFQSYSMSGEFTTLRKLKSSLIENVKYYCFFGVLFVLFLIYYSSKERPTFEGLKVFCITASNTFGLFLLVVLMGYGLVEIPRTCLNNHRFDYKQKLEVLYFKIAKMSGEKCEAIGNLDDYLEEIRSLYIYALSTNSIYTSRLNKIISKCPDSFQDEMYSISNVNSSQNLNSELNEPKLINLNAKIKKVVQQSHRTEVQYRLLVDEAIEVENLSKNYSFDSNNFNSVETWLYKKFPQWRSFFHRNNITYNKVFFLITGYILAFLSVIIVWSEFTFFIKSSPISIFALIVKLLHYKYLWIELFSMLSIAYMCTCCYYTIFKIRIFNYYYLAKHHQTDEYSLIFCGMLLCRLASPLCLNFLSLIHMDSHIIQESILKETAFTQIMGHMDTVSFISDYIFIYLPVLMCVFCVATFFKLDSKIVHYFGFEQFTVSDEINQDLIEEGEKLVKREVQRKNRVYSSNMSAMQPERFNQLSRPMSQEHLLSPSSASPEATNFISKVNKNLFDDI